jgi:hypothetical protein
MAGSQTGKRVDGAARGPPSACAAPTLSCGSTRPRMARDAQQGGNLQGQQR